MPAPSWLRSFQTALTSTLRSEPSLAWQRLAQIFKCNILDKGRHLSHKITNSVPCIVVSTGGLWSATRQSGPDGATVQSIMGSPQGHCKTWDETSIKTKNVRLSEGLCRKNHYSEDCTSEDNQQVWFGRQIQNVGVEPLCLAETVIRSLRSDACLVVCRFHAFLLFLGHPVYAIREVSIHRFSKILSEFALEYRTTRERVLQQKQKRANHRERNKTRGKMITDVSAVWPWATVTQTPPFLLVWFHSWTIPRHWSDPA